MATMPLSLLQRNFSREISPRMQIGSDMLTMNPDLLRRDSSIIFSLVPRFRGELICSRCSLFDILLRFYEGYWVKLLWRCHPWPLGRQLSCQSFWAEESHTDRRLRWSYRGYSSGRVPQYCYILCRTCYRWRSLWRNAHDRQRISV
jgi:hypothetical protein